MSAIRSDRELRLECIRLANQLAAAKLIKPEEILRKADELYGWISQEPISAGEMQSKLYGLRNKYSSLRPNEIYKVGSV